MNDTHSVSVAVSPCVSLFFYLPLVCLSVGLCLSLSLSACLCLFLPVTLFSRVLSPRPALPGITVDDDNIIRRGEEPGTHHVAGTPCNGQGRGVVIRPPHVQYRVTELQLMVQQGAGRRGGEGRGSEERDGQLERQEEREREGGVGSDRGRTGGEAIMRRRQR